MVFLKFQTMGVFINHHRKRGPRNLIVNKVDINEASDKKQITANWHSANVLDHLCEINAKPEFSLLWRINQPFRGRGLFIFRARLETVNPHWHKLPLKIVIIRQIRTTSYTLIITGINIALHVFRSGGIELIVSASIQLPSKFCSGMYCCRMKNLFVFHRESKSITNLNVEIKLSVCNITIDR